MERQRNKNHFRNVEDYHHLANYRQEWELRPESLYIRRHMGMIALMRREGHEELHRGTSQVPVPGFYALQRTVRLWEPIPGDVIGTVDNLCLSIDEAIRHPRTKPLERALGDLTIQGFQDQIPYLKEWMVRDDRAA